MALPFDLRGVREAADKPAWYREQGWKLLKRALELHNAATYGRNGHLAADADEHRRQAEAMFRRADELSGLSPLWIDRCHGYRLR